MIDFTHSGSGDQNGSKEKPYSGGIFIHSKVTGVEYTNIDEKAKWLAVNPCPGFGYRIDWVGREGMDAHLTPAPTHDFIDAPALMELGIDVHMKDGTVTKKRKEVYVYTKRCPYHPELGPEPEPEPEPEPDPEPEPEPEPDPEPEPEPEEPMEYRYILPLRVVDDIDTGVFLSATRKAEVKISFFKQRVPTEDEGELQKPITLTLGQYNTVTRMVRANWGIEADIALVVSNVPIACCAVWVTRDDNVQYSGFPGIEA